MLFLLFGAHCAIRDRDQRTSKTGPSKATRTKSSENVKVDAKSDLRASQQEEKDTTPRSEGDDEGEQTPVQWLHVVSNVAG